MVYNSLQKLFWSSVELGMDELLYKMFQHFITLVREDHDDNVAIYMRDIMTSIIDGSDWIYQPLITVLLNLWK